MKREERTWWVFLEECRKMRVSLSESLSLEDEEQSKEEVMLGRSSRTVSFRFM